MIQQRTGETQAARTGPARTGRSRTGRDRVIGSTERALGVGVLLVLLVYAGDYAVLRFRIATNRSPFQTITVHPYYAVPQKNHTTEFLFDQPRDQTCVNALFPHLGNPACWYLTRHKEQRIDL
jgi:hypothetical protein